MLFFEIIFAVFFFVKINLEKDLTKSRNNPTNLCFIFLFLDFDSTIEKQRITNTLSNIFFQNSNSRK